MRLYTVIALLIASACWAQAPDEHSASASTEVKLTKLAQPIYPPLARQARIAGDVQVKLIVLQDGSIASAEIVSGHPMLGLSALDSAKASQFQCLHCSQAQAYLLTYKFELRETAQLRPNPCCCSSGSLQNQPLPPAEISGSEGHLTVTVNAAPVCICPDECEEKWAQEHSKYRSAKCLYLWKCGHRQIYIE